MDKSSSHAPIQILGAGLTGMSAGHHLGADFEIHEKLGNVGGHAITIVDEGYRFDRTGHLLHLRDESIRAWVQALLSDNVVTVARRSAVFSHGGYTRYPYQANTFGLPPQIAYECLMGFLDAQSKKNSAPEPKDFESFCRIHFGEGFSKHFMIPYNEKLWGVSAKEITAAWCSRFVPLPKLEDVIAGAVGLYDRELGYNANFIYPTKGIGELPAAMSQNLMSNIRLNHGPKSIDWRNKYLLFDDGAVRYQALISTAPLDRLVSLLSDAPPAVVSAANKLRCNKLWYLDVALDVPCGVDWHWMYVPETKYPFYRVGCYSHFSSQMAPAATSNLYVELSSREVPNMDVLGPKIVEGLTEMHIIENAKDVKFMRPRCIDHAYVVFDHHYYASVDIIMPFLEENGIITAGRYGGWNYSSMEDALIFGRDAATKARAVLK